MSMARPESLQAWRRIEATINYRNGVTLNDLRVSAAVDYHEGLDAALEELVSQETTQGVNPSDWTSMVITIARCDISADELNQGYPE